MKILKSVAFLTHVTNIPGNSNWWKEFTIEV
jgi:hypothetical protein